MITILNQGSLPKAWLGFENDRMKPALFNNCIIDVMEELARLKVITRGHKAMLLDRYSEGVERAEELHKQVSLREI